jgi:hypothetical protein
MRTVRRGYVLLVALVSLALLASGLITLGRVLLALASGAIGPLVWRETVAQASGFALVALPVWLLHWGLAQRFAARDPEERAAALRWLYLYGVLAGSAIAGAIALSGLLTAGLGVLLRVPLARERLLEQLPLVVVAAALWGYHWQVAARDRTAGGERGVTATLRRCYVYGVAFGSFLALLAASAALLRSLWGIVVGAPLLDPLIPIRESSGPALVALGLWGFHWRWSTSGPTAADDRSSLLRVTFLLATLGVTLLVTLLQLGQLLAFLLGQALGVPREASLEGGLLVRLGEPAATALVAGIGWWYYWRVLRREVTPATALPAQRAVAWLAQYLTALIALGILAVGVAGVLWVLGDFQTGAVSLSATRWREEMSTVATLALIGLPVWLRAWRPRPAVDEATSLPRRLYLYLVLGAAVLAALLAAATIAYQALSVVLAARLLNAALVEGVRAGAVLLVSGGIAGYHWRVLRAEGRLMAAPAPPAVPPEQVSVWLVSATGEPLGHFTGERAQLERLFARWATEYGERPSPS